MQSVQAAPDFILPPDYDGSTYSHFAVRVEDRHKYILALRKGGIQAGELIDYSVPHLTAYRPYVNNHEFANSLYCSQHMINLPVHPGLSPEQREFVSKLINSCTSSRN
jgi:dTDP-4-amino-4,6-dideoxygalactose transaminase